MHRPGLLTRFALASASATVALLSAGSPAVAAPTPFQLCAWPSACSAASITGSVDWSANRIDATVVNGAYARVTSTVHAGETVSFGVLRGQSRDVTRDFAASTTSVTVTLCVPAVDAPNPCVSTTLPRPAQ